MKILVDESVDGRIAEQLRIAGHQVVSIAHVSAGCPDDTVLARANDTRMILLTADKDFGELVY